MSAEDLCQVGEDSPVVSFVGICQSSAGNFAAEAHVIELALDRSQTGFDVAKALTIGQLRECQTKELIQAGKSAQFVIPTIALGTLVKFVGRDVIHQLREDSTSDIHAPLLIRAPVPCIKEMGVPSKFEKVEIEKTSTSLHPIRTMWVMRQVGSDSRTLVLPNIEAQI